MTHPAPDPVYNRTQYAPKISFGAAVSDLTPSKTDLVISVAIVLGFFLIGWGLVYLA